MGPLLGLWKGKRGRVEKSVTDSCMQKGNSGYLCKHAPILCGIGSADSLPMQNRKPELRAHVSWYLAMDLPAHLEVYHMVRSLGSFLGVVPSLFSSWKTAAGMVHGSGRCQ